MKISFKFFCTAYLSVLLAVGAVGLFFVTYTTCTLLNSKIEQVNTAELYAIDSFLSFTEITPGRVEGAARGAVEQQIKKILGEDIALVQILDPENTEPALKSLNPNAGLYRFIRKGKGSTAQSACRVLVGDEEYFITVSADLTKTEQACRRLWLVYGGAVFGLAVISGTLLYLLSGKIAAPLNRLATAAGEVAAGNYGLTVPVNSGDYEVVNLSKSFNALSQTVQQNITKIQQEVQRREQFISDFTHELKTPMTAIIGYSQMLDAYRLDPTEVQNAARAICGEAQRLEELSRRLLELCVYQNETVELYPLPLTEVFEQLQTTLLSLAKKYGIALRLLPLPVTVLANRALLLSLLYNLADNAFKASNPDGTVTVQCKVQDNGVAVTVTDEGRGIQPESLPYITEPFFREDKARSRRLGGAGLGLALCKQIAELHGTRLQFNSTPNKGTTVCFKLKLTKPSVPGQPLNAPKKAVEP